MFSFVSVTQEKENLRYPWRYVYVLQHNIIFQTAMLYLLHVKMTYKEEKYGSGVRRESNEII